MADTLEITGKNTISFAEGQRWQLTADSRPRGMSNPLTRSQILSELPRLPREIRGHALEMGLSKIVFTLDINGGSGTDMEDALHDLVETLEDGLVYIGTKGARGTEAQVKYQKDGASATSYKTLFYGLYDEAGARQVLGPEQMSHKLRAAALTLYCEPYWHPSSTTNLVNAQTVYNHDDSDTGHDNYVDIAAANIKGDVKAKVRIRIKEATGSGRLNKWVYIASRSQGTPSSFDHWIEAEECSATNWASTSDAERSGGSIRSDSSNASGHIVKDINNPLSAQYRGRYRVFISVNAEDIANTKMRMYIRHGQIPKYYYGRWKWATKAATWQWVDLGLFSLGPEFFPTGGGLQSFSIYIEYEKDSADYLKCDYFMIVSEAETVLKVSALYPFTEASSEDQADIDGCADFPAVAISQASTDLFYALAALEGTMPTLQPNVDNRVYIKALQVSSGLDPYTDHYDAIGNNSSPPVSYQVTIDYLPQYISPLE